MIVALAIFGAKYLYLFAGLVAAVYFLTQSRAKQRNILIFAAIVFSTTYIAAKTVSLFYYDPRPFVVGNFTPLIPHLPDNGFPSDHALLTAAIAAVLFVYNRKTSGVAWIIAGLVGIARVYAGIHHFVDVAGSWAIAITVVFLIQRFVYKPYQEMF